MRYAEYRKQIKTQVMELLLPRGSAICDALSNIKLNNGTDRTVITYYTT